jgi:general secretion pathway protein G
MIFARYTRLLTSRRRRCRRSGVTLLEILIVLVILGLLATLGARQVMSYLGRAKSDTAALQIKELTAAVDLFRLDAGRVPSNDEGMAALVSAPSTVTNWRGPYITKKAILQDPWGKPWLYGAKSAREFEIRTLGGDGAPGGVGEDTDLSSDEKP